MKFFPLIWSMLWRSKARTWLTFCSIAVAFFLFGMLQAVESAFMSGVRLAGDDRLVVGHRMGFTAGVLPLSYLSQIEQVEGVRAVNSLFPFGGTWQHEKNHVQGIAADPSPARVSDPSFIVAPEHARAFQETFTGALVGRDLAAKYGWKVGDHIALTIPQHRKDGTQHWEFDLVGTFWYDDKLTGRSRPANFLMIRYDYWNESVKYPNLVLWYFVLIHDPQQATAVGQAIDALFLNSQYPTKTERESEFQASFLKQMGDIAAIVTAILAAVFFTLVIVAGNAMMQAFRERVPELAVMKTVGFTNRRIVALVAAESVALCFTAGSLGLGLSMLTVPALQKAGVELPVFAIENSTAAAGFLLAAALGVVAALIPAWNAARLSVIEALAVS
jgi:putative ABC transport system permease protein